MRRLLHLLVLAAAVFADDGAGLLRVRSIASTVADADRAAAFYTEVLQFRRESDEEFVDPAFDRLTGVFATRVRVVGLSLGPSRIELVEYVTPKGRPAVEDARSDDRWFQHFAVVVTDIAAATRRLRERRVRLVTPEPQRFPNGRAYLYFRDPDGHPLEICEFPGEEALDPARLFQRIDHTALVVEDLDASVAFYRALGFRLVGRGESRSDAQQRLNGVFGAGLEIATLRLGEGGIDVELLRYATPPGGRPYPPAASPNDLLHRHLSIESADAARAYAALRAMRAPLRSPEVVRVRGADRFLAADPTGHGIEVMRNVR